MRLGRAAELLEESAQGGEVLVSWCLGWSKVERLQGGIQSFCQGVREARELIYAATVRERGQCSQVRRWSHLCTFG